MKYQKPLKCEARSKIATSNWKRLTAEEVQQFIEQGYIVVRGAFARELAGRIVPLVWAELDLAPDDSSTWTRPMVVLRKVLENLPLAQICTQRYRDAIDDLCGAGRWETTNGVGHWPVLFPHFASPPWHPPKNGWHLDSNLDVHHIDSADRGLVAMELFTDVEGGGGGTAVRVGSHRSVARLCAAAEPEGLTNRELNVCAVAATEHLPVVEVSGQAGDIILMHPFTVHASSPNTSDRVRIAANRPIWLLESMNLMRQHPCDYSPVEQAIVNVLAEIKK